jgi:hypothetical protein
VDAGHAEHVGQEKSSIASGCESASQTWSTATGKRRNENDSSMRGFYTPDGYAWRVARSSISPPHPLLGVRLPPGEDTVNGRLVANIVMSAAEWEREIIAERTAKL